jgi:plasmid stabilization system protein ParE
MIHTFVNKPKVIFDIGDIVDYYKSINPELATAFLDRVEEAKKYIADFPEAFQINTRM